RDVVGIFLLRIIPELRAAVGRRAIGKHRTDAGVGQALDGRVGVLRAVLDMRPVEDVGDTYVDGAERTDQVGDVHIIRGIGRSEGALNDLEVLLQRGIGNDV